MKDFKIYFDLGKIEYFDNNCLIQVYKFISLKITFVINSSGGKWKGNTISQIS